jgi:general secretion pathway protein L
VSLLRIRCALAQPPSRCQWALLDSGGKVLGGEGRLDELPRRAKRVQLVVPAAEVLITRARLPQAAARRAGTVLAYAVEEETLREPEASQVSWLGRTGESDVLAVLDRPGLARWSEALEAAGIAGYEVSCETLLLPWRLGEWSLAWNGSEGYVRTGELEGAATDSGERAAPPMALRLMIEEARAQGAAPASIAVYATAPHAAPDLGAWQEALGVALREAGAWDWRSAPAEAGVALAQARRRWRMAPRFLGSLRPAAWITAAALSIHTLGLVADWAALASEQRGLRARMDERFRATFPDAVAVVDPALQMRRKLAAARHAAGQPDPGDFLPMIAQVAAGLGALPPGALRVVSYEGARMTLELAADQATAVGRAAARLNEAGLSAEVVPRAGGATVVLGVRAP